MQRYIAIFNLPRPTYEHAKIDDVIGAVCGRDFKKLPLGAKTVVYLFESNQPPHHLDFGKILLAGDEVAFFELGEYSTFDGFGALKGWINSHRGSLGK